MNAYFIYDGEKITRFWRKLSDFSCWILRKVLLTLKLLNLLIRIATVEAIEEGTFVGERYKLQLSEGLILLVLVG